MAWALLRYNSYFVGKGKPTIHKSGLATKAEAETLAFKLSQAHYWSHERAPLAERFISFKVCTHKQALKSRMIYEEKKEEKMGLPELLLEHTEYKRISRQVYYQIKYRTYDEDIREELDVRDVAYARYIRGLVIDDRGILCQVCLGHVFRGLDRRYTLQAWPLYHGPWPREEKTLE